MDKISTLDELVDRVQLENRRLYVRWSADIKRDLESGVSKDELTGIDLPGLSANGLAVEQWWEDRSLRTWVARRIYDYGHLRQVRGRGTRPWILVGEECGRGPDNEPLIRDGQVLAQIDLEVFREAKQVIDDLPADWGSLRRT
jgi:hypothetical protein